MAAEDSTAEQDSSLELPTPTSEEADVEVEREQDAPEPAELDPETRARRDAALRHVRKFGDPGAARDGAAGRALRRGAAGPRSSGWAS